MVVRVHVPTQHVVVSLSSVCQYGSAISELLTISQMRDRLARQPDLQGEVSDL